MTGLELELGGLQPSLGLHTQTTSAILPSYTPYNVINHQPVRLDVISDVIGNPHYSALPIESWELELGLPNIAYVSHMAHPVTLTSSMTSSSLSIFSYRAPRNAYVDIAYAVLT